MQEHCIQLNNFSLQMRDYEMEGDAIIFLHFSGANMMMWLPVIPYFQQRYRVILVDLRGHGRSDRPAAGYSMDDMAGDITGMMDCLNIECAHIIGSSMGAEVGLSLAANHPQKVKSLVCDGALSCEFGPYSTWQSTEAEFQTYVATEIGKMHDTPEIFYPSVDALVERNRQILEEPGLWNEHVEVMVRYGALKLEEGKYSRGFLKHAMEDYLLQYFHYALDAYYAKLTCPVIMIPSEDCLKNLAEKKAMEGLSKLARQSVIADITDWQHPYDWMIHPEKVAPRLQQFLLEASQ